MRNDCAIRRNGAIRRNSALASDGPSPLEQEAAEVEAEEEAFNPDMAATSVTLGATILLCRENDTQVQVPLFRRGRDTELTEVEVTTEDGSAKLGEVSGATARQPPPCEAASECMPTARLSTTSPSSPRTAASSRRWAGR